MRTVFAHGQLRLYMLRLLEQGPLHGYEVIRDLEARFDGLYSPSAGTIYPRLAKLQEVGLVERSDEGRKSTYRLTSAGLMELDARRAELDALDASIEATAQRLAEDMRRRVREGPDTLRRPLVKQSTSTASWAEDENGSRSLPPPGAPREEMPASDAGPHWSVGFAEMLLGRAVGELVQDPESVRRLLATISGFSADLRAEAPQPGVGRCVPPSSGAPSTEQLADVAEILRRAFQQIRTVLDTPYT